MNTETMELPAEAAAAPAPAKQRRKAPTKVYQATVTALTVIERADLALGASKTEIALKEMVAKYKHLETLDIVDATGRDQVHRAAMELRTARTTLEKDSKAARDDATKFSKAVIAREKELIGTVEPSEILLIANRDKWDAKVEADKAALVAKERARVLAIAANIAEIKGYAVLAIECRTSERVQGLLDKMTANWLATPFEDTYEEFCDEAQYAFNATKAKMLEVIEAKKADEAERARAKAEQEAAAAKLVADRAELDRQMADAAAARLKDAADLKAKQDADAAQLQIQRDADAADLKRRQDEFAAQMAVEDARLKAERDAQKALAAHQAEQAAELERRRLELEPKADPAIVDRSSSAIEVVANDAPFWANPLGHDGSIEQGDVAYIPMEPSAGIAGMVVTMDPLDPIKEPKDADVIWIAATAVADAFGWTTAVAIERLASMNWVPA